MTFEGNVNNSIVSDRFMYTHSDNIKMSSQ